MRLNYVVASFCVVLLICVENGEGTLMLTSLLMAAQTGMMLGKMSIGGLLMMLMAAQQSQTPYGARSTGSALMGSGSSRSTSSRRYKRQGAVEEFQAVKEDKILHDRMVRQIDSAFDSLTCLPKFVCGLNASPPSKKTSLLNDYGHLLKLMLAPDANTDQDDEVDESDEESLLPKTDEEYRLALKEKDKLKEMANEELLDEDPGMISYVLKDVMQDMNNKKNPNRNSPPALTAFDVPPVGSFSESDSDESGSVIDGFSPLTKIMSAFKVPTLKIKSKGTSDTTFDKDPFFEGFKRSARGFRKRPTPSHDYIPEAMTREQRAAYLDRKIKELEQVTDPVQKYEIAEDIGKKLRNKDDCASAYKKCPYEWDQVMTMVNNLRENVLSRPGSSGSSAPIVTNADKVVFLKTSNGKTGSAIPIALNPNDNGITTVTHDLGNGNTVEISMKLFKLQKRPGFTNATFPDDDEMENEAPLSQDPTLGPMEIKVPDNGSALTMDAHEIADDEFENPNVDSAMKIFQAINSGQMKPLKKKNPFTGLVEPTPTEADKKSKEKTTTKPKPIKFVDEEDQSVHVPLERPKETQKEKEDTSEEEDDDAIQDFLLNFRDGINVKNKEVIGTKFPKDSRTTTTEAPKKQSVPIFPEPISRRRYPGTVPNYPGYRRKQQIVTLPADFKSL